MSGSLDRLLSLGPVRPLGRLSGPLGWLLPLASAGREGGAKAERLGAAARAGLPVLPGWVLPVAACQDAVRAGVAAVRRGHPGAARREVLDCPVEPGLARDLRAAVAHLGGRAIVRSSSPLEDDPRWSGAFASLPEVGPDDVVTAVRSCWASAFAVDPLRRLDACGLPLEDLALGILIQPEIRPVAGGLARVDTGGTEVHGVTGHPGALFSGWAEGATARVRLPAGPSRTAAPRCSHTARPPLCSQLGDLIGGDTVAAAACLAQRAHAVLGDDTIEWAACGGTVWLLQSSRWRPAGGSPYSGGQAAPRTAGPGPSAPGGMATPSPPGPASSAPADPALAAHALTPLLSSRTRMPLLAAALQAAGQHIRANPAAPGTAAGRLLPCRPHEPPSDDVRDAILLTDRPLPALAPLLFAARGLITRAGAAGSHLAGVARSLGVPMVTRCHTEIVTGSARATGWLAAIDGGTGAVALLSAPAAAREPL